MTGIGLLNATAREDPDSRFPVAFSIIVLVVSGVADGGLRPIIGNAAAADRWKLHQGSTFRPVVPGISAAAETSTVALMASTTSAMLAQGGPARCDPAARQIVHARRQLLQGCATPAEERGGQRRPAEPGRAPVRSPRR